jgi:hypothetical protein
VVVRPRWAARRAAGAAVHGPAPRHRRPGIPSRRARDGHGQSLLDLSDCKSRRDEDMRGSSCAIERRNERLYLLCAPEHTRAHRLAAPTLLWLGLRRRPLLRRRRGLAPGVAPAHVGVVLPAAAGRLRRGRVRTHAIPAWSAQELVRRKLQLQLVQLRPQRVVLVARHHPRQAQTPATPTHGRHAARGRYIYVPAAAGDQFALSKRDPVGSCGRAQEAQLINPGLPRYWRVRLDLVAADRDACMREWP